MYRLSVVPLEIHHCLELGPYLRNEDKFESALAGHTEPTQSLLTGYRLGPAWAVLDGKTVLGVFGQATDRIWSFWRPLNRWQSREVLRRTKEWVRRVVDESGYIYLHNVVWDGHAAAIRWLKAAGCFVVDETPVVLGELQGIRFLKFRTQCFPRLVPKETANV